MYLPAGTSHEIRENLSMGLLERDACLDALDRALQDAASGAGRVALVSGEAGIGKTALVEWFAHERRGTVCVLWGACDALFTPRPLGPLHDMAAQMQGDVPAPLHSDAHRTAIFSAVLGALQEHPAIAVLEDVHWADEATLDLLRFLGRRIAHTAALLVMTYRDDELGPRHPLRTVLGGLATSPATRRVPLLPLTETAVRTLVGELAIDAAALHRQTGGNPFFVTEVLASAGGSLPPSIRDAVLARVARLSLSAQAVVQAAAVIGPRSEAWVLAEVTGAEPATADWRQRMRAAGRQSIPRGPRPTTRDNPFGLTARQMDILALLAEDLTNAKIAARLYLSPKTVDHHVSTVLTNTPTVTATCPSPAGCICPSSRRARARKETAVNPAISSNVLSQQVAPYPARIRGCKPV
jgi:AAA ATPase domain/Bacterial regulatory proteins, luxR family